MKSKFLLIVFLALATASAFAKNEKKLADNAEMMKLGFAMHVGIGRSSFEMRYSSFDGSVRWPSDARNEFKGGSLHAGAAVDIPLRIIDIFGGPYLISVHPGTMFVLKSGGKKNIEDPAVIEFENSDESKYSVVAGYIDVPMPVSFKKAFFENFAISLDAGPYLAFGLFGLQEYRYFYSLKLRESSFSREGLSRFDAGIVYGATVTLVKKIDLRTHWSIGMTDDEISSFYVSLGYRFK
jgi:hypothetical protein